MRRYPLITACAAAQKLLILKAVLFTGVYSMLKIAVIIFFFQLLQYVDYQHVSGVADDARATATKISVFAVASIYISIAVCGLHWFI